MTRQHQISQTSGRSRPRHVPHTTRQCGRVVVLQHWHCQADPDDLHASNHFSGPQVLGAVDFLSCGPNQNGSPLRLRGLISSRTHQARTAGRRQPKPRFQQTCWKPGLSVLGADPQDRSLSLRRLRSSIAPAKASSPVTSTAGKLLAVCGKTAITGFALRTGRAGTSAAEA